MTRRTTVPGLSQEWSQHQLDLLELVEQEAAQQRAPARRQVGGYCTPCGHTHLVKRRGCSRCTCSERPAPVPLCTTESSSGHETITEAGA